MTTFIEKARRFGSHGALVLVGALASGCAAAEEEEVGDQSGAQMESGVEQKKADVTHALNGARITMRQDLAFDAPAVRIGETPDGSGSTRCELVATMKPFDASREFYLPKETTYEIRFRGIYSEVVDGRHAFSLAVWNHSAGRPGSDPGFYLYCSKAGNYPSAAAIQAVLKKKFGFKAAINESPNE